MSAVDVLAAAMSLDAPGANFNTSSTPPIDPRLFMTTEEICRAEGFQCEVHSTRSEDGYGLVMHRMRPTAPLRAAVLLMSGLMGCSDNFLLLGSNTSLPSMLANAGYDVFLGNQRGTTYSRDHSKWTRRDPQYWRFSLDEVGGYDVAALVRLALRVSGEQRLIYVGYSSGGHSLYTFLELRPEMRPLLRAAFLLGPGVYFTKAPDPLIRGAAFLPDSLFRGTAKSAGEFLGRTRSFVRFVWQACRADAPLRRVCETFAENALSLSPRKADFTRMEFAMAHSICGTSIVTFAHYGQLVKSKKFQAFDWGHKENLQRYGSEKPPEYLLQNVTVPIAIYLGISDRTVSYQDALLLSQKTSQNIGIFRILQRGFDHFDYITNKDVHLLIYEPMIKLMANY